MGLFGSHSHVIIKMQKVDPREEGGARILIKENDRDVSSLEKNLTDTQVLKYFFQRYSVCIRPEVGMCCIKYQVCSDHLDSGFSLSSGDLGITKAMLDDQCTLDYVQIPGKTMSYVFLDKFFSYCHF